MLCNLCFVCVFFLTGLNNCVNVHEFPRWRHAVTFLCSAIVDSKEIDKNTLLTVDNLHDLEVYCVGNKILMIEFYL